MRKVALFVDIQYLYYRLKGKLDYEKTYDYAAEFGELIEATAYGRRVAGDSNFQHMLERVGFHTDFTTSNRSRVADITLAITCSEADVIILLSGDPGFEPVIKATDARVIIMSEDPNNRISQLAHSAIPIGEGLLCD